LIEVIQKPFIRKADQPDIIMARMDYVIICQVIEQVNKMGMTGDFGNLDSLITVPVFTPLSRRFSLS